MIQHPWSNCRDCVGVLLEWIIVSVLYIIIWNEVVVVCFNVLFHRPGWGTEEHDIWSGQFVYAPRFESRTFRILGRSNCLMCVPGNVGKCVLDYFGVCEHTRFLRRVWHNSEYCKAWIWYAMASERVRCGAVDRVLFGTARREQQKSIHLVQKPLKMVCGLYCITAQCASIVR